MLCRSLLYLLGVASVLGGLIERRVPPACPAGSRPMLRPDGHPRKCLPHQNSLCVNALTDKPDASTVCCWHNQVDYHCCLDVTAQQCPDYHNVTVVIHHAFPQSPFAPKQFHFRQGIEEEVAPVALAHFNDNGLQSEQGFIAALAASEMVASSNPSNSRRPIEATTSNTQYSSISPFRSSMFFSTVVFRCIRYGALVVNLLLVAVAIVLFAVTVSSTFWPPKPTVTLEPINKHHQFFTAILCLCAYSFLILFLFAFGIISICVRSSFCLLTYLTGLLVLISIQVLVAVFSVASKPHLHDKFVKDWNINVTECSLHDRDSLRSEGCEAWHKLLDSEGLLFVAQIVVLCLELSSLVLCGIVCERVTRMEQAKIMEEDDE